MRAILFKKIHTAMRTNKRLFFLTAGVGFNLVEPMFKEFPKRTLNVGIAEQNLVGIAGGLSNLGFKVICYSYTNFLAERAFEQIRDDICLHHYNPILIGTTTGFDNAGLGATHHSLDDIAVMKALPHLRIYSPSSSESMGLIFDESLKSKEASFIRFTKNEFTEGKSVSNINRFVFKTTSDTLVIAHGKMVANSLKAAALTPRFSVFAMDQLKPLTDATLKKLCASYTRIFIVEDHFKSGLYNSIAEWLITNNIQSIRLRSISVKEAYHGTIGDAPYLEALHGLTPEKISETIQSFS